MRQWLESYFAYRPRRIAAVALLRPKGAGGGSEAEVVKERGTPAPPRLRLIGRMVDPTSARPRRKRFMGSWPDCDPLARPDIAVGLRIFAADSGNQQIHFSPPNPS